jgi:hypothetical protein
MKPFVLMILMMAVEQGRAWVIGGEIDLDGAQSRGNPLP